METALAVLITIAVFLWTGEDEPEKDLRPNINIECRVNDYTNKDKE